MPGPDLSLAMAEFLRLLAQEVENNRSLARRLSAPFNDLIQAAKEKPPEKPKTAKKQYPPLPADFDPFRLYMEQGAPGLAEAVANMDAAALKSVLSQFKLAPSEKFTRLRSESKLRDLIMDRVAAMTGQGGVFLA